MKNLIRVFCLIVVLVCFLVSCHKSTLEGYDGSGTDPFSTVESERNMVVVISDLHLGANLEYAEINKNLISLENFLKKIKVATNVRELVIAGDMLDEWFVPANINTYDGKDQSDFVQRIAKTNKGVIDAFNQIIQGGKILVTYVPGNHDLTITRAVVATILPGINQARDEVQGLGTYSPAGSAQIAIEHGHRYNFFCAPDPFSNQEAAPGTILPPGYFFTRIAALSFMQNRPTPVSKVAVVTPNTSGNASQSLMYIYYKIWEWAMNNNSLKISNRYDDKIIVTNLNGFTKSYSVNDLVPFQLTAGGTIDVNLYKGIQDSWDQRQTYNKVAVKIPVAPAIMNAASDTAIDNQAKVQYFINPNSNKRVVIFGHTHNAKIVSSANSKGQKSVYANSGTWIDENGVFPDTKSTFVTITLQNSNASSLTFVKLYNFKGEVLTKMASDSLRL